MGFKDSLTTVLVEFLNTLCTVYYVPIFVKILGGKKDGGKVTTISSRYTLI